MALLRRIYLFHTTSNLDKAQTDSTFCLIATKPGGEFLYEFPDQPHNERERGRADAYTIDVAGQGVHTSTKLTIKMIRGDDGWLPSSIWAIGEVSPNHHVLLACQPNWGARPEHLKWFDRHNPDHRSHHRIN